MLDSRFVEQAALCYGKKYGIQKLPTLSNAPRAFENVL